MHNHSFKKNNLNWVYMPFKLTDNEITLIDIADGSILNFFIGCVLSTNGVQIRPNSYITRQASYLAVERSI